MTAPSLRFDVKFPDMPEYSETLKEFDKLIIEEHGMLYGNKRDAIFEAIKLWIKEKKGIIEKQITEPVEDLQDTHKPMMKPEISQDNETYSKKDKIIKTLDSLRNKYPNGFTTDDYKTERIDLFNNGFDNRTIYSDLESAERILKQIKVSRVTDKTRYYKFTAPAVIDKPEISGTCASDEIIISDELTPAEEILIRDRFITKYQDKKQLQKQEIYDFIQDILAPNCNVDKLRDAFSYLLIDLRFIKEFIKDAVYHVTISENSLNVENELLTAKTDAGVML